jgi:hypothetical protein
MNRFRSLFQTATAALSAIALLASEAAALPVTSINVDGVVEVVGGDCYAIGEQVAAQNGGTLAKAAPSTQGGQPVCVVVVLVPGKGGQRPRRVQLVVPQN